MGDVLRWLAFLLIPAALAADDRWVELQSGPFQVLSNAGDRPGREALNELEQVRYVLGTALGKEDLKFVWPFRVVVFKTAQQLAASGAGPAPALARDTYIGAVAANAPVPQAWLRECVRLLIEANAGRMPAGIEKGLAEFYSTATADGTKVTLGAPPPSGERNLDFARIHLMVTDPEYSGKLRVLLYNLQRGAEPEPSYKNAFGKTPEQVNEQAKSDLAINNFPTVVIGGKPLNPQRDFLVRPAEGPLAAIALADLRLAGGADAAAAYRGLAATAPAEAHEGLGLAALRANDKEAARKEFTAATEAGSASARAWFEQARLEPDNLKAAGSLQKATELNKAWAAPYEELAARETDPSRKLQWLKTAASLAPRNAAYWLGVAELYQTHNKYPEAARAWAAAENASVDDAQRERIREARRSIDEKRLEYEVAERKRQEAERERDLQRVKDAAMAEVRAAEERANRAQQRSNPAGTIEQMEIGTAAAGKARGRLARVDCLGRGARLVIETADGKTVRLMIRDPKSVAVLSGGDAGFKCGAQTPARAVLVEYQPKADAKLGTAGEVVTVTYE